MCLHPSPIQTLKYGSTEGRRQKSTQVFLFFEHLYSAYTDSLSVVWPILIQKKCFSLPPPPLSLKHSVLIWFGNVISYLKNFQMHVTGIFLKEEEEGLVH